MHELLVEIQRLPMEERLELLEAMAHLLKSDLSNLPLAASPAESLRGILKPDGPTPSEGELADAYTAHLIEKYS
jgi:hypothetical protein